MAFYDSVKDDIREEKGDGEEREEPEDDNVAFDQLKKEAEDSEEPDEEQESSGTEIEVVGRDDLSASGEEEPFGSPESDGGAVTPNAEQEPRQESRPEPDGGTVEILQRIERQNEEMLDVLRGIKRSLE